MRQPVLLLHARGAKTGQPRVTPLLYTPRGEDFVLVRQRPAPSATRPGTTT